jgi:GNAT superfamily N-acetyltransferase
VSSRYGLEIRAATPVDAPGLVILLSQAGQAIDTRSLVERLVAIREAPGTALIAAQWGPPSGLVVLHWYPTLDEVRPTAQITTLFVGVEDRRRGIGRLLLKAAAQAARTADCGKLELLAPSGAESLHEFCRATGFAEAGRRFLRSLRKQG